MDLVLRRDTCRGDLELRPLEDGSSPALQFPRTARTELRADVLLSGREPVRVTVGTLPDGRLLHAVLRPVE